MFRIVCVASIALAVFASQAMAQGCNSGSSGCKTSQRVEKAQASDLLKTTPATAEQPADPQTRLKQQAAKRLLAERKAAHSSFFAKGTVTTAPTASKSFFASK